MLRFFGLLVFILTSTLQLFAQRFLVRNETQNILYKGIENPLSVIVDGINCKNVLLKTNNGVIAKSNDDVTPCKYVITPDSAGAATISIYKNSNTGFMKIGETNFRVRKFPECRVMLGTLNQEDLISKKLLIALGGLRAMTVNGSICADFSVEEYDATLIIGDSIITRIKNKGARYTSELVGYFDNLHNNDQVLFSKVAIRFADNSRIVSDSPLLYTITE